MDNHERMMREADAAHQKNIDDVLAAIKPKVSDNFYKGLMRLIKESEYVHSLKIVQQPEGDKQTEYDYGPIDHVFNKQWEVGDSGDSFNGITCVPLPDGMFLKFSYSV